jgi:hypothetical protein
MHSLDSNHYSFPKEWNETDSFVFRTSPLDSLVIYGKFIRRKPILFEDEPDTLVQFLLFGLDSASQQLPLHQFQISLLKSGGFYRFFYIDPDGKFHTIERLPLFKSYLYEFYSFEVGDEFHYINHGRGSGTNTKNIIVKREDDPQKRWIRYTVRTERFNWVAGGTNTVSVFFAEWFFEESEYGTHHFLPHALDSSSRPRYSLNYDSANRYIMIQRQHPVYPGWLADVDDSISFCYLYLDFQKDNIYDYRNHYESGKGHTLYSDGYPGFHSRSLSYHRSGSETSGSPVYIPKQETDTINPKLVIFPSPAHNFIRCSYGHVSDSIDATLRIIDMRGITVLDKPLIHHLKPIDISHLQSGIYWAIVRWGEQRQRQKIVVWRLGD